MSFNDRYPTLQYILDVEFAMIYRYSILTERFKG